MSRGLRLPLALVLAALAFALPVGLQAVTGSEGEARTPAGASSLPVAATPTGADGRVTLALSSTAQLPTLRDPRSPPPPPRRSARVVAPRATPTRTPAPAATPTFTAPPAPVATPRPTAPPVTTPAPPSDSTGTFDSTGEP